MSGKIFSGGASMRVARSTRKLSGLVAAKARTVASKTTAVTAIVANIDSSRVLEFTALNVLSVLEQAPLCIRCRRDALQIEVRDLGYWANIDLEIVFNPGVA